MVQPDLSILRIVHETCIHVLSYVYMHSKSHATSQISRLQSCLSLHLLHFQAGYDPLSLIHSPSTIEESWSFSQRLECDHNSEHNIQVLNPKKQKFHSASVYISEIKNQCKLAKGANSNTTLNFPSVTRPFSRFLAEPGDEASV